MIYVQLSSIVEQYSLLSGSGDGLAIRGKLVDHDLIFVPNPVVSRNLCLNLSLTLNLCLSVN